MLLFRRIHVLHTNRCVFTPVRGTIRGHLPRMFWLLIGSEVNWSRPSFLSIPISYKFLICCGITLMCDPINRRQCVSVVLSRLLCHRSRQGRRIHSPLCWLNDQKTEVKKGVNLQMCIVQGAFGDCHAASEMINHHDVYWSMWAVKRILHCHYII